MIESPDRQQTLALSGLFQSVVLVQQLSRTDYWDTTALHQSTHSLLRLDADSVEDIYDGTFGVDLGLRSIIKYFGNKPDSTVREIYQYAASAHQLSLKLFKLKKTSDVIHRELSEIRSKYLIDVKDRDEDDETTDLEIQTALADLYSRTISHLSPGIIVQGTSNRLQDQNTASRVRTALFSGIRSAFLWHQCGGRRWHLFFNRNGYISVAREIVNQ